MEEFKRQFILLGMLLLTLFVLVIGYKTFPFFKSIQIPFWGMKAKCVSLNNGICLSEDAGLRFTYNEADSYCRKRGMQLPTKEDAWKIWISSENCHRMFATNMNVPVSKSAFVNDCKISGKCIVSASRIQNYCVKDPKIKFPLASQYERGNFWLRDRFAVGEHYSINYSTGKIDVYNNDSKFLGVRCVFYDK